MLAKARGTALILTLAPELPGIETLIREARAAGLVVSIGHTDATFDQTQAAIAQGARHAAHVFNAMRPFSHRETGVLGALLTAASVSTELIADGVHVDPAAIQILITLKGAGHIILVSDGTAATGMLDGTFQLGPMKVIVTDGICRNAEGKLAGSTLTLDSALRYMVSLGVPLRDCLAMLTSNPAKQIGLSARKGILAAGADADLVLLDDTLEISGVMTRGAGFY
jgi:N-acetylglucosamine-6-phosphate deacetylase